MKSDFLRIARQNRRRSELSRSKSSRSPSPIHRRSSRRSRNLPKFKIATFYPTNVELWFNQIETQFDLHDITDDDECYQLTCATLSGKVASDVRDVLLQPFPNHKYNNFKEVMIRYSIPFFETSSEYGRFWSVDSCRQGCHTPGLYPTNDRVHLATTLDSTSLESLAALADRALALENDTKDSSVGVAEIQMNDSAKIMGIMENISRRLQQLETAGAKKKHFNNKPQTDSGASRTSNKQTVFAKREC